MIHPEAQFPSTGAPVKPGKLLLPEQRYRIDISVPKGRNEKEG